MKQKMTVIEVKFMRIDKTYSELWSISDHDDETVRDVVKMAINTLQKLQKENEEAYDKGYQQGLFDERLSWLNQSHEY
jgi:hypothetical protein